MSFTQKTQIIFLILVCCIQGVVLAQFEPATVEKSNQKVVFQGKVYFVHTVKQNQTLYSISRTYGVTEQDIANANPNVLLEVLKIGQVIRIPVTTQLDEINESYFGLSDDDFIKHIVKPRETVYYLSRKYNVPEALIYKYNPGIADILQVEQVIRIPKTHLVHSEQQSIYEIQDTLNRYIVKEGDTLYSLSRKFGVSVSDFITENPELRWGLKTGMILNIPGRNAFEVFADHEPDTGFLIAPVIEQYSKDVCDSIERFKNTNPIKIVVMFPFYTREILALDTIANDSIKKVHAYNRQKNIGMSFSEYYQGFLLAIDSLKQAKYNISLFTYDTRSDTNVIKTIIEELKIISPDFIIGPFAPENISLVDKFSKEHKIPVVLPFSKADSKNTNPYQISMMPNDMTENYLNAAYLSRFHDSNIIMIHNEDSLHMGNINGMREALFAQLAIDSTYENALYKEVRANDTTKIAIKHALRSDTKNIIIVASDNEAYVSNILGLLSIQDSKYDISVFGRPSWQLFKNLSTEQLHQMKTVIYLPFYIDYSNRFTQSMIMQFRKKYHYEPYRTVSNGAGFNLAFLGYETAILFSKAYSNYKNNLSNCLCTMTENLAQTEYSFKLNPFPGFSNNSMNFIQFTQDYRVEKISSANLSKPSRIGMHEFISTTP